MGLAAGTNVTSLFSGGAFDLVGNFALLSSNPPRGDQIPSCPNNNKANIIIGGWRERNGERK